MHVSRTVKYDVGNCRLSSGSTRSVGGKCWAISQYGENGHLAIFFQLFVKPIVHISFFRSFSRYYLVVLFLCNLVLSAVMRVNSAKEVMFYLVFVCLSVCLVTASHKNHQSDLRENFTIVL